MEISGRIVDRHKKRQYNGSKFWEVELNMIFEKQIEKMYRSNLFVRQDNAGGLFYFSAADFPGLRSHPYTFKATAGHDLKGYFYHYDDPIPGKLVVFDHGMGNGHRAYMREIERLAKAGFLVFSYDHTGCMESGGEGCNGFAQSLNDLDACVTALNREEGLKDRAISVVGHSWGGFSTMNIAALHPEITHVAAMSGFVSVERIVNQTFGGIMKGYRKPMLELERRTNPDYVDFDAAESLKNTNAKVLLIYSADDKMVHKTMHYDALHEALEGRENIRFLLVDGKNHNPNYTLDAVKYKDEFFGAYKKAAKSLKTDAKKKAFMDGFDWRRMTEQDEAVWTQIIDHLKAE